MECLSYSSYAHDVGWVAFGATRWELELIDYVTVRGKTLFVFAGGQVDTLGEPGGTFGDGGTLPARGSGLVYAFAETLLGDTLLDSFFITGFGFLGGDGPVLSGVLDAFLVFGLSGAGAAGPLVGGAGC
jgi:hypothetical protein